MGNDLFYAYLALIDDQVHWIHRKTGPPAMSTPPPTKTALITGGTGGLGRFVCRHLVQTGHSLIVLARSQDRVAELRSFLRETSPEVALNPVIIDLTDPSAIAALGTELRGRRLDVLVLGAAVYLDQRQESARGEELSWSVNVLGYHRVFRAVRPLLAPDARIVVAASSFAGGLDVSDPEFRTRPYSGRRAYRASKQANRLWTWALARRLAGTGITANAVGPGMAWTGLYRDVHGLQRAIVRGVSAVFGQSEEVAADSLAWACTAPELTSVSGVWLEKRRVVPCRFRDEGLEERLWSLVASRDEPSSERMV